MKTSSPRNRRTTSLTGGGRRSTSRSVAGARPRDVQDVRRSRSTMRPAQARVDGMTGPARQRHYAAPPRHVIRGRAVENLRRSNEQDVPRQCHAAVLPSRRRPAIKRRAARTTPPCRRRDVRRHPSHRRDPRRGEVHGGEWAVQSDWRWPVGAVVAGLDANAIPPVGGGELDRAIGMPDGVRHELGRQQLNAKQRLFINGCSSQLTLDETPRCFGARQLRREERPSHCCLLPHPAS